MAQEWAKKFYRGHKWIKCRQSYIDYRTQIDAGLCEGYHEDIGYIVHHKETLTQYNIGNPDISLSYEKLEYVCKKCHDLFDGHGLGHSKAGLLVSFDSNGQPVSNIEIDRSGSI